MVKKAIIGVITDLVEEFKRSATAYYLECDNENCAKQKVEIKRTNKIIEALDSFGDQGRLALLPLLDSADQGVRTFAAAYLLKVAPERALGALEDIRNGATYFPRMDAWTFLDNYAEGKWGR